jgi:hypothetical protein
MGCFLLRISFGGFLIGVEELQVRGGNACFEFYIGGRFSPKFRIRRRLWCKLEETDGTFRLVLVLLVAAYSHDYSYTVTRGGGGGARLPFSLYQQIHIFLLFGQPSAGREAKHQRRHDVILIVELGNGMGGTTRRLID